MGHYNNQLWHLERSLHVFYVLPLWKGHDKTNITIERNRIQFQNKFTTFCKLSTINRIFCIWYYINKLIKIDTLERLQRRQRYLTINDYFVKSHKLSIDLAAHNNH